MSRQRGSIPLEVLSSITSGPAATSFASKIDGFEEVQQEVDVGDHVGIGNAVPISLDLKLDPADQHRKDSDPYSIDVSQFVGRYPKKAVGLYEKAAQNKKKGKKDIAVQQLEEATAIAPDFYHAHNDLGLLYQESGRMDEAEREFLRAHDLNRSSADPLVNLTSLYIDENEPERAVTVGEQAVKTNSRSADAFFNLGIALYKTSMLDRAEAALKKALELAPKMFQVRLMLANVYMKLRRYDNLMEQLDSYLAENPKGLHRAQVEQMRQQLLQAKQSQ